MKLETSLQLLERVRAAQGVSWWKLPRVMECSESTVKNWKHGRTTVDRKFVPRIAELLQENPEYVLACLEAEREQSTEVLKMWRRIAERFRSSASILLVGLALFTAHGKAAAADVGVELVGNCQTDALYIMRNWARKRRWLAKLSRWLHLGLKSHCTAPLSGPWAGIRWKRSPASAPRSWRTSPVCT